MRIRVLSSLALILVAATASAQRGGRGFGKADRPDWDKMGKGAPGLQLSNRDVENMSPIKLLIDKKKDLKLTDDQVKQLKDIEGKLKSTNEPNFKVLDSLRREMRGSANPNEQDRSRMMSARSTVMQVVRAIRAHDTDALKDALALLDEPQQKTANDLVQKQSQESDETLREKLGGGRSGGAHLH